jgi:universal stress protein A
MGKTILFPTDFSPASIAALRYAVSLAEQSDALLLVLHVRPISTPPLGTVAPDADLAESETSLVRLIARGSNTDKRLRHEFRTLHGDPATEIVRIATEEHADLIVMATAGRSGLKRFLMGSVAEAVAREAPCPVLSLREPFVGNPAIPELGREQVVFPIDSLPPIEASETSALTLLRRAIDARATDVHIDPAGEDIEVRLRIDGRLEH